MYIYIYNLKSKDQQKILKLVFMLIYTCFILTPSSGDQ